MNAPLPTIPEAEPIPTGYIQMDGTSLPVYTEVETAKASDNDPTSPRTSKKPQRHFKFYNPRKNLLHLPEGGFISRNSPCTCGSGLRYKRCCKDAHLRRQKVLQVIDMTGLKPGPHRLEECATCWTPTLRPLTRPEDHHQARIHRMCGKCRQVRQFVCIDLQLATEPFAP